MDFFYLEVSQSILDLKFYYIENKMRITDVVWGKDIICIMLSFEVFQSKKSYFQLHFWINAKVFDKWM